MQLPEKATVATIDVWLQATTLIIRVIPGEEWHLFKRGESYVLVRRIPKTPAVPEIASRSLLEVLLLFVFQRGQYVKPPAPAAESGMLPFRQTAAGARGRREREKHAVRSPRQKGEETPDAWY